MKVRLLVYLAVLDIICFVNMCVYQWINSVEWRSGGEMCEYLSDDYVMLVEVSGCYINASGRSSQ